MEGPVTSAPFVGDSAGLEVRILNVREFEILAVRPRLRPCDDYKFRTESGGSQQN
jgi:hypothetical protein